MLTRVADFLEPLLTQTPPDPWGGVWDLWKLSQTGLKFRKLGREVGAEAIEILTGPARPILDRWFESEQLKATIATDAVIGAFASPSMPGTAYVLFHHVMGECNGVRGVWGYVRGGMGMISRSIAAAAKEKGAEIRTNAAVGRILVRDGRAYGVALADGTEFHAKRIASNADANVTFLKLTDPKDLPADFIAAVKRIDYASATVKINVALSEPPNFTALPGSGVGPQHHGTMHVCPDMDYIERAYDDAKYGKPAANPMLECTMATALDNTLAPPGKHILSMFVQYAPYHLKGTTWDVEKDKLRGPLLRRTERVRPELQGVGDRPAGDPAAGHGAPLGHHRRQHHAGRHVAGQHVQPASGGRVRRLPDAGAGAVPVRRRRPPRRRRDGRCGLNAAREMMKDRV